MKDSIFAEIMNPEQSHTISQVGDNTTPEPISKPGNVGSAPITGYNMRCPAVKRLMREAAELSVPENDYSAQPTEANLFEWHFTIRGPEASEFEDGVYHGRIIFPSQYPMKPPSFILLTPNGRFQTEEKICLSISNYHPETWLPSWSIRTALVALRSFMTTPGNEGAIGSLNFPPEERQKLAKKSKVWDCRECGPIIKLLPARNDSNPDKSAIEKKDMTATALPQSTSRADPGEKLKEAENKNAQAQPTKFGNTTIVGRNPKSVTGNRTVTSASSSSALMSETPETAGEAMAATMQQQNEPIKTIIYDFGIAAFVILILALCLRRLLAIFHML